MIFVVSKSLTMNRIMAIGTEAPKSICILIDKSFVYGF